MNDQTRERKGPLATKPEGFCFKLKDKETDENLFRHSLDKCFRLIFSFDKKQNLTSMSGMKFKVESSYSKGLN